LRYDREIREAIRDRKLLEFRYKGAARIVEPHVYGIHDGEYQILSFQVGGHSSSGTLPDWRRFNTAEVQALSILEEHFPGPRDRSVFRHSDFDTVLSAVS
jgi:predicted DNA-binding transcriptional regulator YafY